MTFKHFSLKSFLQAVQHAWSQLPELVLVRFLGPVRIVCLLIGFFVAVAVVLTALYTSPKQVSVPTTRLEKLNSSTLEQVSAVMKSRETDHSQRVRFSPSVFAHDVSPSL